MGKLVIFSSLIECFTEFRCCCLVTMPLYLINLNEKREKLADAIHLQRKIEMQQNFIGVQHEHNEMPFLSLCIGLVFALGIEIH